MCTRALSQSKNHCWDIISGLFSCKFYTPWAAGRDLVSIRAHWLRRRPQRTVSLRRRWRAQWRAPWRIIAKNSSSGPRRQLPLFFFISIKLLPALARSATKSRTLVILSCVGGGQRITFFGSVYRSAAEFPVKTGLMKLSHNTFSLIFYFDNELLKSKCREL